nr:receptor-like protein 9b isoform X2 [Nicotiana tomentosiformis]
MGNTKLWLWVFFLMIIVANGCLEEERSALLELQADMMIGFLNCCSLPRVKCNLATGRVIKLDLRRASLFRDGWTKNEGFDKLSNLTNLKVLDLQANPLHLDVLSSLCWISSLEVLRLSTYVDTSYSTQTNYGSIHTLSLNIYRVSTIANVSISTLFIFIRAS